LQAAGCRFLGWGGGREIHLKLIDLKRKMNKKKVRTYFFIVLCLEKKKLNGNN